MRALDLVSTLVAAAALTACGSSVPEPPGVEVRSDLDRDTAPEVTPADLSAQVTGNTAFALDVYHQLAAGDDNLFFSPHSIEVALAMTWAGARGQTEADMAQALHFVLPQDRLHPVFDHLDLELARRGEGAEGADGGGFRLRALNAIWGQTGYQFLDQFLDVLARNYGAGLRLLDFIADADGAGQAINAWVEAVTEGRIEDLIPPGALDATTRLVLVNAIYFNAAWAEPFDVADTHDGPFHTAAGATVDVPMMHQAYEGGFHLGDGYTALELLYDGGELSMMVLVPDPGVALSTLEARLTADLIAEIRAGTSNGMIDLTMPRWQLDGTTVSLADLLSTLGMGIAFTDAADLSGMNGTGGLYISDVLHQAFVKVNEAGTEAAAATAVIVGDTSLPPEGPTVVLDRPFVYLIQDRPTGQVLFIGRVTDPS